MWASLLLDSHVCERATERGDSLMKGRWSPRCFSLGWFFHNLFGQDCPVLVDEHFSHGWKLPSISISS